MSDLATLKKRLDEAEAAEHSLLMGESAVSVSESGRSVSYTAANAGQLASYIQRLKDQIAKLEGGGARRAPIYI